MPTAATSTVEAYERFGPAARRVVANQLGESFADDAVQEAALYLVRSPRARVTQSYFIQLAINRARDLRTGTERRTHREQAAIAFDASPRATGARGVQNRLASAEV